MRHRCDVSVILAPRQRGVALTGRNTTGPPSRAAPGELRCKGAAVVLKTTTDAREHH